MKRPRIVEPPAGRDFALLVAGMAVSLLGDVIVWMTLTHRLVPSELRGRIESVDWLASVGLVPVSFALTGPVAALIGAGATLLAGSVHALRQADELARSA